MSGISITSVLSPSPSFFGASSPAPGSPAGNGAWLPPNWNPPFVAGSSADADAPDPDETHFVIL